jgi:hypothetical protein
MTLPSSGTGTGSGSVVVLRDGTMRFLACVYACRLHSSKPPGFMRSLPNDPGARAPEPIGLNEVGGIR